MLYTPNAIVRVCLLTVALGATLWAVFGMRPAMTAPQLTSEARVWFEHEGMLVGLQSLSGSSSVTVEHSTDQFAVQRNVQVGVYIRASLIDAPFRAAGPLEITAFTDEDGRDLMQGYPFEARTNNSGFVSGRQSRGVMVSASSDRIAAIPGRVGRLEGHVLCEVAHDIGTVEVPLEVGASVEIAEGMRVVLRSFDRQGSQFAFTAEVISDAADDADAQPNAEVLGAEIPNPMEPTMKVNVRLQTERLRTDKGERVVLSGTAGLSVAVAVPETIVFEVARDLRQIEMTFAYTDVPLGG